MGRRGKHTGYWRERRKERDYLQDEEVDGWRISKWILEREDGIVWIRLMWLRVGTSGVLL
jgi:hypothetical protein